MPEEPAPTTRGICVTVTPDYGSRREYLLDVDYRVAPLGERGGLKVEVVGVRGDYDAIDLGFLKRVVAQDPRLLAHLMSEWAAAREPRGAR